MTMKKYRIIESYGEPGGRIGAARWFASSFTTSRQEHPLYHFRLSLVCVTAVLCLSQTALSTQIINEKWISPSTNTAGLGTLQDPYDASTQAKFDAIMQNLTTASSTNSTIHILPGTYQTQGSRSWTLQSGQRLLGSGIDVTKLQLVPNAVDFSIVVFGWYGTNEEVCDLTVDCNYASGNYTYSGVSLSGARNAIRRVRCINAVGNSTQPGVNHESFPLGIDGSQYAVTNANSAGNIIEECEVSQFQGTGPCSAIVLNSNSTNSSYWISGSIVNCHVFLPLVNLTNAALQFAYNCAGGNNVMVHGNFSDGATAGYYSDSGPYTNIVISHNIFKNPYVGVWFNQTPVPVDGVSILFNRIEPLNTISNSGGGITLWGTGTYIFRNASIIGNRIGFFGGSIGNPAYALDLQNVSGCTYADNLVDTNFLYYLNNSTLKAFNNFDLDGNFASDSVNSLNQISPPNGWTRRTVTTSNPGTLLYSDYYVAVAPNPISTVNMALPSAGGHSGKVLVVGDEGGNAATFNISIFPTAPNKINGSTSSKNITTAYGRLTFISDGTNWFAQ